MELAVLSSKENVTLTINGQSVSIGFLIQNIFYRPPTMTSVGWEGGGLKRLMRDANQFLIPRGFVLFCFFSTLRLVLQMLNH